MAIAITAAGQSLSVDLASGERMALYGVPVSYSDDGLFLALWAAEELEPVPACASEDTSLLLALARSGDGGDGLVESFAGEGVTYAEI